MAEAPLPQDGQWGAPDDNGARDEEAEIATAEQAVTAEFEFGVLNVAQGKTATQSSTAFGGVASRAVDGNKSGTWATGSVTHTNTETDAWWEVDLGKNQFVLSVDVSNRTDCCSDRLSGAVVQLLDERRTVMMSKTLTGSTAVQHLSFLPGRSARYVRIQRPGYGILSLGEVEVFAPSAQLDTTDNFCWLPSYGRGAGTVPDQCPGQQKDGGLCYNWCASGYYGVGPVCWQACPSGWRDDGTACWLDASVVSANNSSCPWYDQCGLTFAKGCTQCPAGYHNDGCTCRRDAQMFYKGSYGRGAGSPMSCSSSLQYDAGLCYTPCKAGYHGVGPVCWGVCPASRPYACGAGCAVDATACQENVASMIEAPIEAATNIALLVLSAGGTAAAQVATKVALSTTQKASMKASLKSGVKKFAGKLTSFAASEIDALGEECATQLMDAQEQLMSGNAGSIDLVSMATSLDPTGLAAVGVTFAKPVCQ